MRTVLASLLALALWLGSTPAAANEPGRIGVGLNRSGATPGLRYAFSYPMLEWTDPDGVSVRTNALFLLIDLGLTLATKDGLPPMTKGLNPNLDSHPHGGGVPYADIFGAMSAGSLGPFTTRATLGIGLLFLENKEDGEGYGIVPIYAGPGLQLPVDRFVTTADLVAGYSIGKGRFHASLRLREEFFFWKELGVYLRYEQQLNTFKDIPTHHLSIWELGLTVRP